MDDTLLGEDFQKKVETVMKTVKEIGGQDTKFHHDPKKDLTENEKTEIKKHQEMKTKPEPEKKKLNGFQNTEKKVRRKKNVSADTLEESQKNHSSESNPQFVENLKKSKKKLRRKKNVSVDTLNDFQENDVSQTNPHF